MLSWSIITETNLKIKVALIVKSQPNFLKHHGANFQLADQKTTNFATSFKVIELKFGG